MSHSLKGSITQKTLVIVGVCLFVILTLFILFIEHQSYQFQLTQLKHQQARITQGQSILLSEQLEEGDEDAVFFTISGILANPAIVGVKVDYQDGREDLAIGDTTTSLTYSENITHLDDNFNVSDLASITTFATTDNIDQTLQNRVIYLACLIAVLLVTILSIAALVLKKFVGNPLALIVNTIEDTKIDETAQINWESSDEIGLVVQRLNALHRTHQQRVVGLKQELSDSELREAERLRNLANASFESVLIYIDNLILDTNDRMQKMLNLPKNQIVSAKLDTIFEHEMLTALEEDSTDTEKYFSDLPLHTPAGSIVPVEMHVSDFSYGSLNAKVAVMRDITDRVEAEKNIRYLAHHDGLTKLLNRASFMDKYSQALNKAESEKQSLAVMYMDLDKFKEVNDIYGHATGDKLLKNVADGIQSCISENDFAARLGGDEFAIVVSGKDFFEVDPERSAEKLLDAVSTCKSSIQVGKDFGASIGVAIYNGSGPVNSDLLAQADLALYHAKNNGRNKYKFYDQSLGQEQTRHRTLIDRLLKAIQNDYLEMHYQPQVMTRWNDNVLGNVSPIEIVEAANKERISEKLSEWVLKAVLRDVITWPDSYQVSVNLTPEDLKNKGLTAYISALLLETGFPADRLDIEITESAIISDLKSATKIINDLKALGVSVALDDFGTGYSSLSFLHQLPFDRIKLDKSFINTSDAKSLKIAKAIIDLGKEMNVEVLAEGVETLEQLERMRHQGCHMIQGYYFSKPMPADEVVSYLEYQNNELRKAG